jgi:hypothetical protein
MSAPSTTGLSRDAPQIRDHNEGHVIEVLMHYLPMEVSGHLMRECPSADNAYRGREIVHVVHNPESDRVPL